MRLQLKNSYPIFMLTPFWGCLPRRKISFFDSHEIQPEGEGGKDTLQRGAAFLEHFDRRLYHVQAKKESCNP
jgi:hypothetical protein